MSFLLIYIIQNYNFYMIYFQMFQNFYQQYCFYLYFYFQIFQIYYYNQIKNLFGQDQTKKTKCINFYNQKIIVNLGKIKRISLVAFIYSKLHIKGCNSSIFRRFFIVILFIIVQKNKIKYQFGIIYIFILLTIIKSATIKLDQICDFKENYSKYIKNANQNNTKLKQAALIGLKILEGKSTCEEEKKNADKKLQNKKSQNNADTDEEDEDDLEFDEDEYDDEDYLEYENAQQQQIKQISNEQGNEQKNINKKEKKEKEKESKKFEKIKQKMTQIQTEKNEQKKLQSQEEKPQKNKKQKTIKKQKKIKKFKF
ncbi:hypothetical protein IMG5_183030 [Ichthyophthirius multifiliis]|uniref:Transmembrane protein n=1 Tax=Ichthyophthirius multifiliis TaxID=5932 RepID=G0R341_ICHMU|nr:hypothetical protein IMG5_183030 [Ichthyophthirius multifiliis]EGR28117.1 hypothetical protein IMG5_183030 [Ichthyophthirius multifiliis]|eukprot:XP_004027462.1 hypothetical protein IMG5_183030 [Ichthyophthirius multifiliis]